MKSFHWTVDLIVVSMENDTEIILKLPSLFGVNITTLVKKGKKKTFKWAEQYWASIHDGVGWTQTREVGIYVWKQGNHADLNSLMRSVQLPKIIWKIRNAKERPKGCGLHPGKLGPVGFRGLIVDLDLVL